MRALLRKILGFKTCDRCLRAFQYGGKTVPVISFASSFSPKVEIDYRYFCNEHKIEPDAVLNGMVHGGAMLEESVPLKFHNAHVNQYYPKAKPFNPLHP